MTAKQVLIGAAQRIEEKGWTQHAYGRMAEEFPASAGWPAIPVGSPCGAEGNLASTPIAETDVIGALRQQVGRFGLRADHDAVDEAKAILRRRLGVENLAHWNDAPERTKEQVIAALKAAAKAA